METMLVHIRVTSVVSWCYHLCITHPVISNKFSALTLCESFTWPKKLFSVLEWMKIRKRILAYYVNCSQLLLTQALIIEPHINKHLTLIFMKTGMSICFMHHLLSHIICWKFSKLAENSIFLSLRFDFHPPFYSYYSLQENNHPCDTL